MNWLSELCMKTYGRKGEEEICNCTYLLKKKSFSTLHFICDVEFSTTKNILTLYPTYNNGEIIQLNGHQIDFQLNELKKKTLENSSFREFVINNLKSTVTITSKTQFAKQKEIDQQILQDPLSEQSQKSSSYLARRFKKIQSFLNFILPDIENFMVFFGMKIKNSERTKKNDLMDSETDNSVSEDKNNIKSNNKNFKVKQNKINKIKSQLSKSIRDIFETNKKLGDFLPWGEKKQVQKRSQLRIEWQDELIEEFLNYKDKITEDFTGELSKNIFEITEMTLKDEKQDKIFEEFFGGVSLIEKQYFKEITYKSGLINSSSNEEQTIKQEQIVLAKKSAKEMEENLECGKVTNNTYRFRREKEIVEYINKKGSKKNYLLDYYYHKDVLNTYYLEWVDMNLTEYLYLKDWISYDQLLDICIQIVYIVKDLHQTGVVHRDIKPSNFLVRMQKGKPMIKLIDFSDSMIINTQDSNAGQYVRHQDIIKDNYKIYSTGGYSPIECHRTNKNHFKQRGLINVEIDYWSVGYVIHEILLGFSPVSYYSTFYKDIQTLWYTQFLYLINQRKKSGLNVLLEVAELIKNGLINPIQNKRINLEETILLLLSAKIYLKKLNNICFYQN